MKAVFCLLLAWLVLCLTASGQESPAFGGKQSLGLTAGYAPTSRHILVGIAQGRRTFTAGVEYTRRIWEDKGLRFDYSAEFSPLFRESDPTEVATKMTVNGVTTVTPVTPTRILYDWSVPVGIVDNGKITPIYAVLGKDEKTYAVAFAPIGARAVFLPRWRVQPTFAANGGVVISSRDLPIDDTSQLNFQITFGPGVQVFVSRNTSVRLEYVYSHISNAYLGVSDSGDPGIDQGVFRLTLSRYR
jgi:opacity protein-like surface antigen